MLKEFLKKEGIVYSDDEEVIRKESMDMSFMSIFLLPYINKRSDIVVYPKSEEEVIKVVEKAIEEHIPIVPRGGGMNNIGGVIPLKGGIILDMRLMNKITIEDETVIAEAGAKYYDNGKFNFNPRVYPSSFDRGVTVGGHISGGCCGIGSFKYGYVWDQVVEVRMVNPRGKVVTLRGGDVKISAHAEGTTGIITRVKLLTETNNYEFKVIEGDLNYLIKLVSRFFDEGVDIYHLTLRSPEATEITGVMKSDKWQLFIAHSKEERIEEGTKDGLELWNNKQVFYGGLTLSFLTKRGKAEYLIKDTEVEVVPKIVKELKGLAVIQVEFILGRIAHLFVVSDSNYFKIREIVSKYPGRIFELHDFRLNTRLDKDHVERIVRWKRIYDKEDLFNPGKVELPLSESSYKE
ncbi:MAG: FAD-binding oxidoreductase [Sulfolobus sp.]